MAASWISHFNHCEPDHTGCINRLLEQFPHLTVVVSPAGAIYIKQIANWELNRWW